MNEIPSRTTATAAALAIALWVHASMTHAPVELSTANSTAQSTGAAAVHGFHMLAPDDDGEIALSLYWRSVARKIALHPRAQLLHTPSAGPLVALVPKYLNATECDALINMHDAEKSSSFVGDRSPPFHRGERDHAPQKKRSSSDAPCRNVRGASKGAKSEKKMLNM